MSDLRFIFPSGVVEEVGKNRGKSRLVDTILEIKALFAVRMPRFARRGVGVGGFSQIKHEYNKFEADYSPQLQIRLYLRQF